MANREAPSIQEIRAREEARREARKARQRSRRQSFADEKLYDLRLRLADPSQEGRCRAYEGLRLYLSDVTPRMQYHDARQLAVMRGESVVRRRSKRECRELSEKLTAYGWKCLPVPSAKEGSDA